MLLTVVLLILDAGLLAMAALFTYESIREQEPRAPKWGAAGVAFHLVLGLIIIFVPPARPWIGLFFGLGVLFGLALLIPPPPARSLKGASGYLTGPVNRVDERTIVFARNRSIIPGSEQFEAYYTAHPEHREFDDARRARGGPLGRPGSIDGGYPPNVAMLQSAFSLPALIGHGAEVEPFGGSASGYKQGQEVKPVEIDPAKASRIVKGWARQLGADLVGICRTDPRWTYSHRGEIFYDNHEDWGREISEPLPFAVVVATHMDPDNVAVAPHTPTVVESGLGYAKGAYISTIIANWFGALGYSASAEHNRHYSNLLVPMAVDAGLGELGRQGYLIADRYGPGVRLFAVTTDMPLTPDSPIDLGAEAFCEKCLKCAESCPSKSIPLDGREENNGIDRWKLNEETCFEYWGKVGTDCCVCMAICPFSRPYRSVHRLVRVILKRSALARKLFPHVDNVLYGRRWRPRQPREWIAYPKAGGSGQTPEASR